MFMINEILMYIYIYIYILVIILYFNLYVPLLIVCNVVGIGYTVRETPDLHSQYLGSSDRLYQAARILRLQMN